MPIFWCKWFSSSVDGITRHTQCVECDNAKIDRSPILPVHDRENLWRRHPICEPTYSSPRQRSFSSIYSAIAKKRRDSDHARRRPSWITWTRWEVMQKQKWACETDFKECIEESINLLFRLAKADAAFVFFRLSVAVLWKSVMLFLPEKFTVISTGCMLARKMIVRGENIYR